MEEMRGQPDLPRRRARSSSPGARTSGVLSLPPSAASGCDAMEQGRWEEPKGKEERREGGEPREEG
jgi:hypothetical protein